MATTFLLTLDTTGPAGVTLSIDAGATVTADQLVDLAIATTDTPTTNYSMKIWGDLDDDEDQATYRAAEVDAPWIGYATSKTGIKVSDGDGVKTINIRVRDAVLNPSGIVSDTITLDTTAPITNVLEGPDPAVISKVEGARISTTTWTVDVDIVAYELRVVPAEDSVRAAGTLIGTANGSAQVSGGAVAALEEVTSTIDGRDLEAASPGDGDKIVKVFGQDAGGSWTTVA
jgi:hypothetical protein